MKRPLAKLAITVTAALLLYPTSLAAQASPTTKKAARVSIKHGPELELASDHLAIIRWTSNNPGGSPEHYGIVHYGTDTKNLSETAKSPIRLNPGHPDTVFRVRVDDLKPKTTYYYTVESMGADGTNDGVKGPIKHFTTAKAPNIDASQSR
ncbi:fibronectin type III domain-containing protein [Edaphobacter sp. HDX4]|uniref:fibronectin type III domain-containing protein n=1 Tax=Edaphobacter sp. HDX4 TaxID=2794064 RepID=UPI002FE692C2